MARGFLGNHQPALNIQTACTGCSLSSKRGRSLDLSPSQTGCLRRDGLQHPGGSIIAWWSKPAKPSRSRLLDRLLTQIARVLEINQLTAITLEVVETARESLVIGTT
jgi:hypothetical protein